MSYVPNLRKKYQEAIIPALTKEFSYHTVMQVPKLEKIVINQGVGAAVSDKKIVDIALEELTMISGQKSVQTMSKKDISNFKLRRKMPIGVKVTLRRDTMYEFLDRLISIALPSIRDFRGISGKSFDGRGNYALGIREQFIFPEIDYDKVEMVHGLDVIMCTSAGTDKESKALLRMLGIPFRN